jgi:hypothetical protein
MALGDIGVISPEDWYKTTDLTQLEVPVTVDNLGVPSDYDYSAGAALYFVTGGSAGQVANTSWLPSGHVGLMLDFRHTGAFVLKAKAVEVSRISNLAEVEAHIIDLYRRGRWKRHWVIVTEVAVGGPAVVLIADRSGAKAGVNLGADAVVGDFDLGRIRGNLGVGFEQGLAAKFTTRGKSAVLWRGMYVSDGLISSVKLKQRSGPEVTDAWGRRPSDGVESSDVYLAEPEDLMEILTASGEPEDYPG